MNANIDNKNFKTWFKENVSKKIEPIVSCGAPDFSKAVNEDGKFDVYKVIVPIKFIGFKLDNTGFDDIDKFNDYITQKYMNETSLEEEVEHPGQSEIIVPLSYSEVNVNIIAEALGRAVVNSFETRGVDNK